MVFKTVFVVAKSIPTQILAQNKWYLVAGKINIHWEILVFLALSTLVLNVRCIVICFWPHVAIMVVIVC